MKLGIQTQRLDQAVFDFCVRAKIGVFKAITPQPVGLLQELKAVLPDCVFIYRPHFKNQPLDDPEHRAHEAVDAAMGHLKQFPYDYTELYNETGLWDEAYDYIALTIEAARLLAIQGQKLLAYSFAWGNPSGFVTDPYEEDPARWLEGLRQHWIPYFDGLRMIRTVGGELALHQYKIPNTDDKFSIFRHRLVRQILPADLEVVPIWLTEFGLDDKADPGSSGWRGASWNWTAERYAAWLIETSRAIGKEVAGGTIFICGTPDWWSFDILDHPVIADAIAQVNEEEKGMLPDWIIDLRGEAIEHTGYDLKQPCGILFHHAGSYAPVANQLEYLKRHACYHFALSQNSVHYLRDISERVWHAGDGPDGRWNSRGVAVCFLGCYMGTKPRDAMFATARKLHSWLIEECRVPDVIKGHKDVRMTDCPGNWYPGDENPNYRDMLLGNIPSTAELRARIAELESGLVSLRNNIDELLRV